MAHCKINQSKHGIQENPIMHISPGDIQTSKHECLLCLLDTILCKIRVIMIFIKCIIWWQHDSTGDRRSITAHSELCDTVVVGQGEDGRHVPSCILSTTHNTCHSALDELTCSIENKQSHTHKTYHFVSIYLKMESRNDHHNSMRQVSCTQSAKPVHSYLLAKHHEFNKKTFLLPKQ